MFISDWFNTNLVFGGPLFGEASSQVTVALSPVPVFLGAEAARSQDRFAKVRLKTGYISYICGSKMGGCFPLGPDVSAADIRRGHVKPMCSFEMLRVVMHCADLQCEMVKSSVVLSDVVK